MANTTQDTTQQERLARISAAYDTLIAKVRREAEYYDALIRLDEYIKAWLADDDNNTDGKESA